MRSRGHAAALGARWAAHALRAARRDLAADGLHARVDPPPTTARGSLRAARMVLKLGKASCLERSFVLQAWWAARGVPLDVVVGVKQEAGGVKAHAWVDEYERDCSDEYRVIRRHAAPSTTEIDGLARDDALPPRRPQRLRLIPYGTSGLAMARQCTFL